MFSLSCFLWPEIRRKARSEQVFVQMKCEGFSQITDLADYLDNNRLIAHYCGFNIMEPLPSYWTYDRFLKKWITLHRKNHGGTGEETL